MAGLTDLTILRVSLDVALTDFELRVGKNQITLGRIDGPFQVKFGSVQSQAGWVQASGWQVCDSVNLIDVLYITAAAVPGGILEFWTTNLSGTGAS